MKCCVVGDRSDAAELDEALRCGRESLRSLAARSGARKTSLRTHRVKCLGLAPQAKEAADVPASEPAVDGPAEVVRGGPDFDGPVVQNDGPPTIPLENARASGLKNGDQPHRSEVVRAKAGGGPSPVRARTEPGPSTSKVMPDPPGMDSSFEDRALYIADLMSRAKWGQRQVLSELCVRWGVQDGMVRQYARAASVALAADRGPLMQQVEVSIAYCTAQREINQAQAERNEAIASAARERAEQDEEVSIEALRTETFALKHAAQYRQIALSWQEHLDRVQGVLKPQAPSVQVNVMTVAQSPEFEALMNVVLDELQSAPKIRERVIDRVRGEIENQRAKKALPVRAG